MVILLWVLLRNPHSDSHIGCNCMHCCQEQEGIRVPCQCLVIFVFLMMAFLTGVELNLKVVFISIALVMRDVEYFKGCILAITINVVSSFLLGFLFSYSLDFEFFVYSGYLSSVRCAPTKDYLTF